MITIADTNCFPPIEGTHEVSVLDKNSFSVAYEVDTAGDKGRWIPLHVTTNYLPLHLVNPEHVFTYRLLLSITIYFYLPRYDLNNVIEPYIVSQTQYSLNYGEGSMAKYDFDNINKFITKYPNSKPFTTPFVYVL